MAGTHEVFKTAPAEVRRFFETKRSIPSFDWRDIAPEEHAFSWTVAKSAGFDVLEDIRAAVGDAITNQLPFEEFRTRLTPILQEKGWWGRRIAVDPANDMPMVVQLGSARRLRTIYWSNIRSAHAAGEWERTQRTKAFLPFLVYTLSQAERRRVEHEGFVGTVLHVDDPWWHTHYPPNGWGCACGVRQVSRRQAEALGWTEATRAPEIEMRPWLDKRNGETVMVPAGIDPGWQTNPGLARGRNMAEWLYGRVDMMPAHRQQAAIADIVGSPLLDVFASGKAPKGSFLPVAQIPARLVEAMGVPGRVVRLSGDSTWHIVTEHHDRDLSVPDLRAALQTVAAIGTHISVRGKSVVFVGEADGRWWRVVVKSTLEGREWWMTSFHRKSAAEAAAFVSRERKAGRLIE